MDEVEHSYDRWFCLNGNIQCGELLKKMFRSLCGGVQKTLYQTIRIINIRECFGLIKSKSAKMEVYKRNLHKIFLLTSLCTCHHKR